MALRLTRWNKQSDPLAESLRAELANEGLSVMVWQDLPGTVYPAHFHAIPQVRVVVRGYLRIGLAETGEEFTLGPGDRMDLPAGTPHWEDVVGDDHVLYLAGDGESRVPANLA